MTQAGVDITTLINGTYTGPYWQTHDVNELENYSGQDLVDVGPLFYDTPFGPPDDANEIVWVQGN